MQTAENIIWQAFNAGIKPEPVLKCWQWADEYRVLTSMSSSEPGPYRTSRTPYMKEIQSVMSVDDLTEHIVLMKASQIGFTEVLNNFIGYIIDHSPGPMLLVQPTVELAKRNSKSRLDPLIENCPRLSERVKEKKSRDSSNTLLSKTFTGGLLVTAGANSAAGLRSIPIRFLLLDEVDAFPPDVDGEGSPIKLARARTRTFNKRKIVEGSTPTVEGLSRISEAFERSDQRYFYVPCPDCGHMQTLIFKNLKWEKDEAGDPVNVHYECEECRAKIQNWQKTAMLDGGEWRKHKPESKTAGFHISALYSPVGWYSWENLVAEFLEAKGNPEELKVFMNTVLGLVWKEKSERPNWHRLYERRETYKQGVVNNKVGFLTCGVDIQKDRIEAEVVGWCRGKESYSIDYRVLHGDTAGDEVWLALSSLLDETWPREENDKLQMGIKIMAVDSGYNTQEVYNWVRKYPPTRVLAVKGVDTQATAIGTPKPTDVTVRGKRISRGVKVWPVGVSILKSELYGWLRQNKAADGEKAPPGFCHFPQYDEEYFRQLTAEAATVKLVKGYKKIQWEKLRDRNEALDCRVYARAAATVAGMDRYSEAKWKKLALDAPPSVISEKSEQAKEVKKKNKKRKKRDSIW